jgi:hypothetical protein
MGGEAMNDVDYQSTLECLRIAARLIMPLDLDGFLERAEALAQAEADCESRLGIRRLARLARAMREDDRARENAAVARCSAPRTAAA